MAPRGRGGSIHIGGDGGGGDSSVDPITLDNYFSYATLGVYGLYFLYMLFVIPGQKNHFPHLYVYAIISCGLLSSVLSLVSSLTVQGPCDSASYVYFNLMLFLNWLFLFEPSRHIIVELRNSAQRISPLKMAQYTSSAVGITLLCGYVFATVLLILNIVFAIITYYVPYTNYLGYTDCLVYSPWLFALMWFFLAASHWPRIKHKRSYALFGFLVICIQVGVTLVNSPGVFVYADADSMFAPVIVGFVLIRCCHFIALYVGVSKAGEWVNLTSYDIVSNQK